MIYQKQKQVFQKMCATIVLHGELEDIAHSEYVGAYVPVIPDESGVGGFKGKLIKKTVCCLLRLDSYDKA